MKLNLLSSGVPLERLTATTLLKSRYRDLGERVFERDGKYFSIDMVAMKDGTLPEAHDLPARLSLFVECKYLRPPNVLAFAPFPAPESSVSSRGFSVNAFSAAGCEKMPMVRAPVAGRAFDSLRSAWIPQASATCYKGAVVSDQDVKDIFKEAQYQLAFPLAEAYLDDLKGAGRLLKVQTPIPAEIEKILSGLIARLTIALYVPIVVTNAPLYVLNDDADLKTIEESKRITDVARAVPFVNYTAMVPAEMSTYLDADKEAGELMQITQETSDRQYNSVTFSAMNLYLIPRRYHFVQQEALTSFLGVLESEFRQLCLKITEEQQIAPTEDFGVHGGQDSFERTADSETEKGEAPGRVDPA